MEKITSLNNDRVRRAGALLRNARRRLRENTMVVEGLRLVNEACTASPTVDEVFFTEDFAADERGAALLASLSSRCDSVWEVTPQVLAALSDTETPQGIVAVVPLPMPEPTFPEGLTLIVDEVRDPGNLGTILRTAWAARVRMVLLPPGTVDPTNPKVVRAGMGAHFHVPIRRLPWDQITTMLKGAVVWLAEATGGIAYDRVDWVEAAALIVGGEAEGAGEAARMIAAGHHVYIPMAESAESLNAAVAAAVLLFEAVRQRGS